MYIRKVVITNFKCFKEPFTMEFNDCTNIIVGNNESGKSTILQAVNLALTGYLDGRSLSTGINQYIFNKSSVQDYISALKIGGDSTPPKISIELFFGGDDKEIGEWKGDGNSEGANDASGLIFTIDLHKDFQCNYEDFVTSDQVESIPIEFYRYSWNSFSRDNLILRHLPIRSILVDSTNYGFRNSSGVYISRIIKGMLTPQELIDISQAHRRVKENFQKEPIISDINDNLNGQGSLTGKRINLAIDLGTAGSWEESMLTEVDDFPFQHIGKGMQSSVRIEIALASTKAKGADVVLLEEPENHQSHASLNQLLKRISEKLDSRQIICTTHSSFVANKLGIKNLTLLGNNQTVKFSDLSQETQIFFSKLAGYDTLRFILCEKAILVEGDSDELIVQRAYMDTHNNRLPIDDGIDVISVGTSFLRFLEIAEALHKSTVVVTDNDGSTENLEKKYSAYLGENAKDYIKICYEKTIALGNLKINGKGYNYNTLEPSLFRCNDLALLNRVLGTSYQTEEALLTHMYREKTLCALSIFSSTENIAYPNYIHDAITD